MIAALLSVSVLFAASANAFPLKSSYKGQPIQNAPDPSIAVVQKQKARRIITCMPATGR